MIWSGECDICCCCCCCCDWFCCLCVVKGCECVRVIMSKFIREYDEDMKTAMVSLFVRREFGRRVVFGIWRDFVGR